MKNYTVRYAHLSSISVKVGTKLKSCDKLGVMGNTGASTGPHLHIDCVEGYQKSIWRLSQMTNGKIKPAPVQLNYFIDDGLFLSPFTISTYFFDPLYPMTQKKQHPAYDVYPTDKKSFDIYWNRAVVEQAMVTKVGYDAGYGNYILVKFRA